MVSLVVATMGRVGELDRLLASLERQSYKQFEVIVVDQNPDERLAPVLLRYSALAIKHVRCSPGASKARNVGLGAASGEIIGFPDDDCWYDDGLLVKVARWFEANPQFDGLLGVLREENGHLTGPKWPRESCSATPLTLWNAGITPVTFLTRRAVEAIGGFDERIGPGVPSGYHSGEDVDYFLRGLAAGFCLRHEPQLTVFHPSFHNPVRIRQKAYAYSKGGGLILRRYHFSLRLLAEMSIRSAGGASLGLLKGDLAASKAYVLRGAGLLRGYFAGESDIATPEHGPAEVAQDCVRGTSSGRQS